ncbi:DUF6671 family protein [Adhaeribacter aquaticus]|uniref:DUF6671 family protein n=1 Tax=Adhaeribacter aquaticus TaxID=299567 RepID=UPI0004224BD2|nr:DUF6671 family protein [Adhaeribacter aquaticus]
MSPYPSLFSGRELVIATKHHKEQVMAPLLEQALGVKCIVPANLDTDILGTFTGEVERTTDPLETARKKCQLAIELTGCTLAIANEGSFGPHPAFGFIPADEEILVLVDKQHELEITIREISMDTNFVGELIHTEAQLIAFAESAQFPAHGLIIRPAQGSQNGIIKGITDWDSLRDAFQKTVKESGAAYVETDMRALYNPTRMAVIKQATQKLVKIINTCCPQCKTPGFGITATTTGLPCSLCSSPTQSVLSLIYTCQKCAFSQEEKYPNKKFTEDPTFCDVCNP